MFKTGQTEEFEVDDNVLDNLLSNERILYKLRKKWLGVGQIIALILLFTLPFEVIFIKLCIYLVCGKSVG